VQPSGVGQKLARGAVDLGRPVQRGRIVGRANGDHEKILDVEPAAGVHAAAQDLDLR
jgi:hypothetical protein